MKPTTLNTLAALTLLALPLTTHAADHTRPLVLAQSTATPATPNSQTALAGPSDFGKESAWSKYGPYNVYLGAGTSGLAIGTSFAGSTWYNGRLEYNRLTYKTDGSTDSINYDADLRLQNQAAYLDLRPFAGKFRVSLGVSSQQSHLDIRGDGTLDTGDKAKANARVELPSVMPYAGFGWGLGKNTPGLGMFFDVGAFIGKPKVTTFTLTSDNPQVQAEADKELPEKRKEVEDDVAKLKVYPVVKFGLTYQF